jgi:HTH-type transcriptional regulator/antitoxin HigA
MTESSTFRPDWVSAPGDTIADLLEERKLSPVAFARRLGCTPERTSQLLDGRDRITSDIARRLEEILGASEAFWMSRELQYREGVARLNRETRYESSTEWLRELPLNDMIRFGWLRPARNPNAQVAECLNFFGVSSVAAWHEAYTGILEAAAFRASSTFVSRPGAIAAWLRQGEIESDAVSGSPWDATRFREALQELRSLTRRKDPNLFIPELKKRCAECGVAVAVVRAPDGCTASGATRFLSPSRALMLLSFRHLSDDHFWFTFFHEAGHLLLHSKKALFLEGANMVSTKEEDEANEFSARVLIPSDSQPALLNLRANAYEVIRFAVRVGIAPGIVVGQLQHRGRIKRNQLNSLKRRFTWEDD